MNINRDVTIRLYRHDGLPANNEVEITRNGKRRTYGKVRQPRINAFARLVKKERLEVEWDFLYFTEIEFSFDKEIFESEDEYEAVGNG